MPKQLKFAFVAAVLLVLGLSAQGTVASWRAQSTTEASTISTGSLRLLLGPQGSASENFRVAGLDSANLLPGGFVQAPLRISNAGTVDLAYNVQGISGLPSTPRASDSALASASVVKIYAQMPASDCSSGASPRGEILYSGPFTSGASFSSPRTLRSGAGVNTEETLCLRLELEAGAPQTAAGGKLDVVLKFVGQQK